MKYFNKITVLFLCLIATSAFAVEFKSGVYLGLVNAAGAGFAVENPPTTAVASSFGFGADVYPISEYGIGGEVWFGDFAIGLSLGRSLFSEKMKNDVSIENNKAKLERREQISGIQINPCLKYKSLKIGLDMMLPSAPSFSYESTTEENGKTSKESISGEIKDEYIQTYMQFYIGQDIDIWSGLYQKKDALRLNWRLGYDLNSPFTEKFYAPQGGDLTYVRFALNVGISYYMSF